MVFVYFLSERTHIKMFIEKFAELSIIIRSGLIIAVIPRQIYDFFFTFNLFSGGCVLIQNWEKIFPKVKVNVSHHQYP